MVSGSGRGWPPGDRARRFFESDRTPSSQPTATESKNLRAGPLKCRQLQGNRATAELTASPSARASGPGSRRGPGSAIKRPPGSRPPRGPPRASGPSSLGAPRRRRPGPPPSPDPRPPRSRRWPQGPRLIAVGYQPTAPQQAAQLRASAYPTLWPTSSTGRSVSTSNLRASAMRWAATAGGVLRRQGVQLPAALLGHARRGGLADTGRCRGCGAGVRRGTPHHRWDAIGCG